MKKTRTFMALFVTWFLILGLCQVSFAEKIRMTVNSPEGENAPMGISGALFAKRINELTNGQVEAKVFYRGVLGGEMATLESMLAGNIDINWVSNTVTTNVVPDLAAIDLPYNIQSIEHAQKLLKGPIGQYFNSLARDKGIRVLGWAFAGSRCIIFKEKRVTKVEELKGMKIRSPANPLYLETIKSWGANPVTIPWTETYLALSQGVVDGIETAPGPSFDKKHYEVGKYLLRTNHLFYFHLLVASEKKFQTWPKDIQAAVMFAGAEAAALGNQLRIDQEKEVFKQYEALGVKVLEPEREGFIKAGKAIYPKFVEKASPIMINLIKEMDK